MDRRIAGQGEACVLLVKGQEFFEIIEHFPETGATFVLFPDGHDDCGYMKDLIASGHVPTPATKIIKGNGEWMYFAPGTKGPRNLTGTSWFTRGGVFV